MTNVDEYFIFAFDCADAKLHNINIGVIWQCLEKSRCSADVSPLERDSNRLATSA